MKPLTTYMGSVYPWHCDHIGHMSIMWYAGKFDEANWHLLARIGLTPTYLREQRRSMVVVQQNINYQRELLAGDIVSVESRFLEVREKSLRYMHEMRNAESNEAAAICVITAVHLDRQARKACPLPGPVRLAALGLMDQAGRQDAGDVAP